MCGGAGFVPFISPKELASIFVVNPSKLLIQKVYDYFHPTAIEEALTLANTILKVNADHVAARFRRGKLYILKNQYTDAIEEFEHILSLTNGNNSDNKSTHLYLAHFFIGWIYYTASMWQRAKEQFTLAINMYDDDDKVQGGAHQDDFWEASRKHLKHLDLFVDSKVENVSSMVKGWFGVTSTPVQQRHEENTST